MSGATTVIPATTKSTTTTVASAGLPSDPETLRAVLAAVGEGLLVLGADRTIRAANEAAGRMLGLPPAALIGRDVRDLEDERAASGGAVFELTQPFAGDQQWRSGMAELRRPDDAPLLAGVVCSRLPAQPGADVVAVLVFRDITARLMDERALRESEARFRAIFSESPLGVVITAAGGLVERVNQAFAGMLGFAVEELAGLSLDSLWHPQYAAAAAGQWARLLGGQADRIAMETCLCHRDGTDVWVRISQRRLADEGGGPHRLISVVEDLRDRKRLELELAHAQKLEAVGRLAAGIAHEINTPIQFVGDNVRFLGGALRDLHELVRAQRQVLAEHGLGADPRLQTPAAAGDVEWLLTEVPAAVEQSIEGVERVAHIVGAMKMFAHPGGGNLRPTDLNRAVRDALVVARNEYKYVADVSLDLADLPPALCDVSEINQVLLNLIVNAGHAIADAQAAAGQGAPRGTIAVRTSLAGSDVAVAVSDTGVGIPAELQRRIFDPFFTTKQPGRGSGQGLALCYAVVVEHHGGRILVDSEPGSGSTFTVLLPIAGPVQRVAPADSPQEAT